MYSSTIEYQRASLKNLPTENYNLPFMGHKNPYLSSLLVTCHQSSRLYGVRLVSLELNDSFHIIIRSGCLINFVSEVKQKRTVLKVFIKCESLEGGGGVKSCLYVSLVIFLHCDI